MGGIQEVWWARGTRKFINQTSEKHFRIVVVRVVVAIAIDNGKNST